ncbi:MAG: hypothetical protein ABSE89_05230 [Sedimentisphaerales bacterium]
MWISKALKKIYHSSFLRWWLMISATYSASSVCPYCGKPACPAGFSVAALIGFLFASFGSAGKYIWRKLYSISRKLYHPKTAGQN